MICQNCGHPLIQREVEGLISWGCAWCLPVAREAVKEASQSETPPLVQLILGGLAGAAVALALILTAKKIDDTYNWLRDELA